MIKARVVAANPMYKGVAFRTIRGYVDIDALPQDLRLRVIQAALEYEIYAEEAWYVIRAGLKPEDEENIMEVCNKGASQEALAFYISTCQRQSMTKSAAPLRTLVPPWYIRLVRAVEFRKWQLTSWVKRLFGGFDRGR
jgi:hypothetical protein